MGTPRRLGRPPITEALIDFRIATDPAIDAARLAGLRELLQGDYPRVEEQRAVKAEIRIEPGGVLPRAEDLGFHGLFFRTSDGVRVAQFRRDGFTLNQLPPYQDADVMISEAMRLWQLFSAATSPTAITRVAFRYINVLRLPYGADDDFNRFLTAAPPVPPEAPQRVSSFLSRVVTHEPPDVGIVTQTMEARGGEDPVRVTIDIDVYQEGDTPPDGGQLRSVLHRLRLLKNRLFFALLADEALELYV